MDILEKPWPEPLKQCASLWIFLKYVKMDTRQIPQNRSAHNFTNGAVGSQFRCRAWWLPPWPRLLAFQRLKVDLGKLGASWYSSGWGFQALSSKTAKHHQAHSVQKTSCFLLPMEATNYLGLKQIVRNSNIQWLIILFPIKIASGPFLDNPFWKPWLLMVPAQNLEALLQSLEFSAHRAPGIRTARAAKGWIWSDVWCKGILQVDL